jgi:hypothetical protein
VAGGMAAEAGLALPSAATGNVGLALRVRLWHCQLLAAVLGTGELASWPAVCMRSVATRAPRDASLLQLKSIKKELGLEKDEKTALVQK